MNHHRNDQYIHLQFIDGRLYSVRSAWELVSQMWGSSFGKEPTADQYMINFAARVRRVSGLDVDTTSPENFLESLLSIGLVEYQVIN